MTEDKDRHAERIVAGVDGSPSSVAVLRWALRQAHLTGATVDAVMAWQTPMMADGYAWAPVPMLDDYDFQGMAGKTLARVVGEVTDPGESVAVRQLVAEGKAARVLLDAANGADLLVIGGHGHGGFTEALLGSVSQQCAHHAPCPVVIIRGERHEQHGTA